MTTPTKALKIARAVIEREIQRDPDPHNVRYDRHEALAAIDAAHWWLALPAACPYYAASHTLGAAYYDQNCAGCVKRMTAPAPAVSPLTDEEIIRIAQTMGKKVPGVSDYDSWPGMGYEKDARGEYTVPVVPKIAVQFARAIERKVRGE